LQTELISSSELWCSWMCYRLCILFCSVANVFAVHCALLHDIPWL